MREPTLTSSYEGGGSRLMVDSVFVGSSHVSDPTVFRVSLDGQSVLKPEYVGSSLVSEDCLSKPVRVEVMADVARLFGASKKSSLGL